MPVIAVSGDAIEAARERLRGIAMRTPLVPLVASIGARRISLKLETLQPVGSFKIRGAGSAISAAPPERLAHGVYTASAGNMAQGVAWCARALGVPCTVIVPEHAPVAKTSAVERMGGTIIRVPFERWWQVLVDRSYPGLDGLFVHPVSDPDVIAGNATIAAEILEDAPDTDTVLVPFGGGGLSCGIALGLKARGSSARVIACEVETAAPLTPSLLAGKPCTVARTATFVDGIGAAGLMVEMWPLIQGTLNGSIVSSLANIADAVRYLAERAHVVAEGAGAAAVAAAMSDPVATSGSGLGERVVCIVSGGNIDMAPLTAILQGRLPA
jgi:threonine dehydratase